MSGGATARGDGATKARSIRKRGRQRGLVGDPGGKLGQIISTGGQAGEGGRANKDRLAKGQTPPAGWVAERPPARGERGRRGLAAEGRGGSEWATSLDSFAWRIRRLCGPRGHPSQHCQRSRITNRWSLRVARYPRRYLSQHWGTYLTNRITNRWSLRVLLSTPEDTYLSIGVPISRIGSRIGGPCALLSRRQLLLTQAPILASSAKIA